jgi:cytochrome c oxidase assembly factor CtaG
MDPLLRAALQSWSWRGEVIIPLVIFGLLYSRGWWMLRHRGRAENGLATVWRLVAYWVAWLLLAISLLSPVDTLSGFLFSMHMIQHLFMVMFAPPLLMVANPLPFLLWGLPARGRAWFGHGLYLVIGGKSAGRQLIRTLFSPGVVWMMYIIVLWGWHDPNLYNAALRYGWVHDLEHITFFLTAMLFWWRVVGAGPKVHQKISLLGRVGLAIAGVPANMILGVFLAFATSPIYSFYEQMPRITGLSVLEDQALSGIIMWIPGSMMYIIAALILLFNFMRQEERRNEAEKAHLRPHKKPLLES